MRVEGIRVDGFGVLAGLEIADLPPGLTVVHGANEAGKSTLLDFLRGVLFGYPDRRHRIPFHAPLRGGRHGGAVRLTEASGARWILERHVDTREALLTAADGSPAGAATLSRLLGGADADLFRSVFAFGLGELAALDLLERDQIREVVFSAGVLGAGRSASNAVRVLDQQRSALVRQRRSDAAANALRARLDHVETELRRARREAESYPSLLAEHQRLRRHFDDARHESEALRRRVAEIDRLVALWPTLREREHASARRIAMGELDDTQVAALEWEGQIRWLAEGRSGHLERVAKQGEHRATIEGAELELAAIRARLGSDELVPIPLGVRDRVDGLARRVPDAMVELRAATDDGRRAQAMLGEATSALEELGDPSERDTTALEAAISSARRLQQAQARLERLEERSRSRASEEELHRLRSEQSRAGADQTNVVLLLVTGVVGLAIGGTGLALSSRYGAAFAVLGVLGLLGALLSGLAALRMRRNLATQLRPPSTFVDPDIERTATEVAGLAASLGVAPSEPDSTEDLLADLQVELTHRQHRDSLERAVVRAQGEANRATERRAVAGVALRRIDEAATSIAEELGFSAGLSLEGLSGALDELKRAEELRQRVARVQRAAELLAAPIEEFEISLHSIEKDLGAPGGDDITRSVRDLESILEGARARAGEEAALRATVDGSDRRLAESLGVGESAQRLRDELTFGDPSAWDAERSELAARLEEAEAVTEERLARARDAERDFEALRASSDVASLELEHETLSAELVAVLERWLVYGAAKSLLESCLARYERERQPKVIAYASQLFAEITDGRYVQLVAREDDDGRRRRIDALSASGERVDAGDLSRGTAEQLYLCLRLAFATTFAEQSVALPIVVDDVLVNFDPTRAAAVARVFARVASEHQVLAFTCHPHVVDLFVTADPTARVVELAT